jgi:hypothetical protein
VSSARAFGSHSGAESREKIAPSIEPFEKRRFRSGLESKELALGWGDSDRCRDLAPWPVCCRFLGRVSHWTGGPWGVDWAVDSDIDPIQPLEVSVSKIEMALFSKVNDCRIPCESGIILLSDSKDDDSERVRFRRPDGCNATDPAGAVLGLGNSRLGAA